MYFKIANNIAYDSCRRCLDFIVINKDINLCVCLNSSVI